MTIGGDGMSDSLNPIEIDATGQVIRGVRMLICLRWPRDMIEELVGKVLDNSEDLFDEMEEKE